MDMVVGIPCFDSSDCAPRCLGSSALLGSNKLPGSSALMGGTYECIHSHPFVTTVNIFKHHRCQPHSPTATTLPRLYPPLLPPLPPASRCRLSLRRLSIRRPLPPLPCAGWPDQLHGRVRHRPPAGAPCAHQVWAGRHVQGQGGARRRGLQRGGGAST